MRRVITLACRACFKSKTRFAPHPASHPCPSSPVYRSAGSNDARPPRSRSRDCKRSGSTRRGRAELGPAAASGANARHRQDGSRDEILPSRAGSSETEREEVLLEVAQVTSMSFTCAIMCATRSSVMSMSFTCAVLVKSCHPRGSTRGGRWEGNEGREGMAMEGMGGGDPSQGVPWAP